MYNNYKKTLPGKIELNENHTIVPDLEMLKTFLKYRSHSRSKTQIEFRDYLIDYFDGLNQDLIIETDNYGNLYVTKGKSDLYPCMVAHLDINQDKIDNFEIITVGDWIFGFDTDEAVQCGLGFDDKAGVAAAIEVFNRVDVIKLFFPLDEECGLVGTSNADLDFFTDCTMLIQCDRRSYTTDFINYTNGREVCSKEFTDAISEEMKTFGYSVNRGVATDIGGLKASPKVDCIASNLSVGYYNEHSNEEVLSISRYTNCVNFAYVIISKYGKTKWNHISKTETYKPFSVTKSYGYTSNSSSGNKYSGENTSYYSSQYDDIYDARNPFDDDPEFDYYNNSYKTANSFKVDSQWKLELEEIDRLNNMTSSSHYNAKFPVKLDVLDDEYSNWIGECYAEYADVKNRKKLKSINVKDGVYVIQTNQEVIDYELSFSCCPMCNEIVESNNKLLLDVECFECESIFNIPEDSYEYTVGRFEKSDLF